MKKNLSSWWVKGVVLLLSLLQWKLTFKSVMRVVFCFGYIAQPFSGIVQTPSVTILHIKPKLYCWRFDQFTCFSSFVLKRLYDRVKCCLRWLFHMSDDALGYSIWDFYMISLISFLKALTFDLFSPLHKSLLDGDVEPASIPTQAVSLWAQGAFPLS